MANRTTIVDNYTWNNTQIAQVGQIFAGSEEESYEQIIHLGADYVLGKIFIIVLKAVFVYFFDHF